MHHQRTADRPLRRGMPILWGTTLGVLLTTAALIVAVLAPDATAAPLIGAGTSGAPGTRAHSFSIAGTVGGLFPGNTSALKLKVSNPQTVAIEVTSLTTTVGDAAIGCAAANVTVSAFSGHLVVPAGKARKATVFVTLVHSAPDACQGAQFPFTYHGLATKE
jgi:hypothetical protein